MQMAAPTEDYYPDHDGGTFAPIAATTVATWKAPAFLENLAIDAEGAVFVTVYSHKRVDRYDPATGATTPFAEVPAPPMGLAFDAGGVLCMTAGTLLQGPGFIQRLGTQVIRPRADPAGWLRWRYQNCGNTSFCRRLRDRDVRFALSHHASRTHPGSPRSVRRSHDLGRPRTRHGREHGLRLWKSA